MFSSESWLSNQQAGFYNNVATQSLRFDDGSQPYLTRTPSSAGNKKTWTWSGWIKRTSLVSGSPYSGFGIIFAGGNEQNMWAIPANCTLIAYWINTEQLAVVGSGNTVLRLTSARQRDLSAWYHFVVAMDTTQSTANDRTKVYINGVQQTSFDTTNNVSQNTDLNINETSNHLIGGQQTSNVASSMSMYLSETNFVDGQALDASYFGETKNGVWIPKKYTGSYGTNGFRLKFDQTGVGTASTSTIGADTSGNTNHWTSSGIVASDCNMPDSPENNFATLNPLGKLSASALSEGNLKAVITSGTNSGRTPSTFAVSSGKWYWEVRQSSANRFGLGVFDTENYVMTDEDAGIDAYEWAWLTDGGGSNKGILFNNASSLDYGNEVANGEIIMVALDADNNAIWFGKENSWFNRDGSSSSATVKAQIEAGTTTNAGHSSVTGNLTPVFVRQTSTDTLIVNYGQDSSFAGNETAQGNTDANGKGDFYYAPPSGFLALCTSNLPEPTISPNAGDGEQADDYFNTVLYTGNATARSITGVGFQPDLIWLKGRSGATANLLQDSIRGVTKYLISDSPNGDGTLSDLITSFDSDGFSLGTNVNINGNSATYVGWNWKAGGTAVSNTDGTITSSVSANTTAGFSIVTYTGTGALATVGHSLGVKPSMMIIKNRDDSDSGSAHWLVYHEAIGATHRLKLDSNEDSGATAVHFNNTEPTSSVFTVNTSNAGNGSSDDFVAYCFAEIEGFSRFGSYTGNSSTDGTFVYTGFRPAWVMVKYYTGSGANHWWIWDSVRNTFNVVDEALVANLSVSTQSPLDVDFVSNGFKFRTLNSEMNGSSASYIYMAFAEAPFKYANAR